MPEVNEEEVEAKEVNPDEVYLERKRVSAQMNWRETRAEMKLQVSNLNLQTGRDEVRGEEKAVNN